MEKSKLYDLCGLYKSKQKDGTPYLRGKLKDGTTIFIFANKNKKEDKHPDYNVRTTRDLLDSEPERNTADAGGDNDFPF